MIDSSEVTVDVKEGKVVLEGTVRDRSTKHQIEDLADNCPGVKDVDNRIRVSRGQDDEQGSSGQYGSGGRSSWSQETGSGGSATSGTSGTSSTTSGTSSSGTSSTSRGSSGTRRE
jgi:hypothetical protein